MRQTYCQLYAITAYPIEGKDVEMRGDITLHEWWYIHSMHIFKSHTVLIICLYIKKGSLISYTCEKAWQLANHLSRVIKSNY